MARISKSVGFQGCNEQGDILTVQYLLNCIPTANGGPIEELKVDGEKQGPNFVSTVEAIRRYQKRIFQGWCDGRVDPNGQTLMRMNLWDPVSPNYGAPVPQGSKQNGWDGSKGSPGNSKQTGYGGGKQDAGWGQNSGAYGGKQGGYNQKSGVKQQGYPDSSSSQSKGGFNDPFNQKGGNAFTPNEPWNVKDGDDSIIGG